MDSIRQGDPEQTASPARSWAEARPRRLEDRTLLSVSAIHVNTAVDALNWPPGLTVAQLQAKPTISLRDAVNAVDNTAGSWIIDLPVTLGTYNLGNVDTGVLNLGNPAGQSVLIQATDGSYNAVTNQNAVINQTVSGNGIFVLDYNFNGSIGVTFDNLTLQGATNVNQAFGGAAILGGDPGDTLALNICTVQDNSTAGNSNGAGLSWGGGGSVTIANSTFANNVAAGALGGAIAFINGVNAGNLTVTNSKFTGNSATTVASIGGQGGAIYLSDTGGSTITASSFTTNQAAAAGGAIYNASSTLTVSKSRFSNPTSTGTGRGITSDTGAVTANDNWWGAGTAPNTTNSDTTSTSGGGSVTATSFLTLTLTPGASSIATNASTGLTAKVVSSTATGTAVTGTGLEGLNLSFGPGALAGTSVMPFSVPIASGQSSTTFNSGATAGTAHPSVSLDNATVTTTVNVVGKPTANSQTVAVSHNTTTPITLTGSDPNIPSQPLTFAITASPSHGTITGFNASTGALSYIPTASYAGPDSFTFTVTNSSSLTSAAATVTLNVAAAAPTANSQTVPVSHNTAKPITLTGSDPNIPSQPLTFAITASPSHGTVTGFNASTGALSYTPTASYAGPDSFTFTVTNTSSLTSAAATVTLNVAAAAPTANSQTVPVSHNTTTPITLTGSDPNTPTQPLTFAILASPSHGAITSFNASTGALAYTPTAGYAGPYSFTFTVTNSSSLTSAAATVTLNVVAAKPTANPQTVNTNQNAPVGITLTGSDPNSPAQTLTFAILASPTHGLISGTAPNLTYTPNAGYSGPDTLHVHRYEHVRPDE